ncbi:sensor histidine kinase [Thalassotalea atypica]|uniref:sensor histidine kinase n=1 Tax=Thalassotalea atypica TaxID=2054316 RepID=UPI002572F049|nr:HAMP domain-containing sensor histidine kinase [Thalassotalea atypica]
MALQQTSIFSFFSLYPMSLYKRLALSMTLVFALILYVIYNWSSSLAQYATVQAEQKLHTELAQHLADDNPLLQDGVYDKKALENLFHTLMLLGPAFEFYYLDPAGKILTYSADANKIRRQSVDLSPIHQFIAQPTSLPIFGQDPRDSTREKIFSAAPIYQDKALQGYLYVIIGGEIYDSIFSAAKQDQALFRQIIWVGISLILLLVMILVLFRYFTSPLRTLAKDMEAIKAANFDQETVSLTRWQPDDNNEVAQLGCAFLSMVEQINQQIEQLNHNDKIRRELLAHLSHDLRTPLSAMQGYIEILSLKNDSLTLTEREQYITTVMRNAEQLKLLIDQIFELAHLEDGQVSVHFETFPIGELVHDIIAKFSVKAQQANIELCLLPQNLQHVIYSDIAKLERILSNLIENALRHTPTNGKIVLAIVLIGDRLSISVTDTGSGINDSELAYIFDARYRASNAKGEKNKHAGLGLAISKKLSQILNSELTVESKLGQGCKFSLSMAANK